MDVFARARYGDADAFLLRFVAAMGDMVRVAGSGSGPSEVGDPVLDGMRGFFRAPLSEAEAAREIARRRAMPALERAAHEEGQRWDLANLLHVLGPEVREWRLGPVTVHAPGVVLIRIEDDWMGTSAGAVRQVVECAGGEVVLAPAPPSKRRWWT